MYQIQFQVILNFCFHFSLSTWPRRFHRTSRETKSWDDTRPPGAVYDTAECSSFPRTLEVLTSNYYENWERTLLKAIHHIFFPGALNPLNIFYPKLATSFLVLQILMGLLITAIGLWFLLWAPNTRIQDNPYWSGLIVSVLFSACISPTN